VECGKRGRRPRVARCQPEIEHVHCKSRLYREED
jgi:hypothetical protein